MGLGSLTAGCAIAKAILLDRVFAVDYTWAITKPALCTIAEHLTSMTLVSLPALKPFFNKLLEASSRLSSGKHSDRPSQRRQTSAHLNNDSGGLKSEDAEKGELPVSHNILKTTDFRVSSHNSISSHRFEDEWPLPPDSVHTHSSGRSERPLGNSWRME